MGNQQASSDEEESSQVEDSARRLYRLDTAVGLSPRGILQSWESLPETTRETYRRQARAALRRRRRN